MGLCPRFAVSVRAKTLFGNPQSFIGPAAAFQHGALPALYAVSVYAGSAAERRETAAAETLRRPLPCRLEHRIRTLLLPGRARGVTRRAVGESAGGKACGRDPGCTPAPPPPWRSAPAFRRPGDRAVVAGRLVHEVPEHVLDADLARSPRAPRLALDRLVGDRLERLLVEGELDVVEREAAAGTGAPSSSSARSGFRTSASRSSGSSTVSTGVRPTSSGMSPKRTKVLRDDLLHELVLLLGVLDRRQFLEADRRFIGAALDDLVDAVESAAADKEDVGGVDLDKFLLGMLAPALRAARWRPCPPGSSAAPAARPRR